MKLLARKPAIQLSLALGACFALSTLADERSGGDGPRLLTSRASPVELALPDEAGAFTFAVFGDRTGGPPEGVEVLARAVAETTLFGPDLVFTVGDLIQGYNQTPKWLEEMREYKGIMDRLPCPWFPVAGNHDVYWRGPEKPPGEHEANYELHFGPLWYAVRHKDCWFIALYSDEGDPATGLKTFSDPKAQRMSPEQFAWLEATLAKTRGAQHVFCFVHHPRWIGGNYGDDWERVHALLVAAGNVSAVFAGHIHHMRYDPRDGIEYFTLATVGGGQSGVVPAAGFLHHYQLVTVRERGIDVVSVPVGGAQDPRRITAEVSREARALAGALTPRFEERAGVRPDRSVAGTFVFELENPVSRPVELTLVPESADSRWRFEPDHQHRVLAPGERARFALVVARGPHTIDEALREPELSIRAEYLAEDWRVPLPARNYALPLDLAGLPTPGASEGVLLLDGIDDHLRVESEELRLPDGPLTLEGWLRADEFRPRQGFVTKTENSEYGIFVNAGRVDFLVHLDGQYASARSAGPILEVGRWHHVAGLFDGEELRVYVDGLLAGRSPGSGSRTPNALPLIIGGDVGGGGSANSLFPGRIDEVRLSSVARYTGERFEPARRYEPDDDTVLLLHLDEAIGPWLFDSAPTPSHARLRGGARIE